MALRVADDQDQGNLPDGGRPEWAEAIRQGAADDQAMAELEQGLASPDANAEMPDTHPSKQGFYKPTQLADAEAAPGAASAGSAVPAAESGIAHQADGLYKGSQDLAAGAGKGSAAGLVGGLLGRMTRRQKGTAGGIGVGVVGLAIAASTFLTGPLQLKHLSEILKKSGWSSERTAASRLRSNYRFIRTGSVGETRVGAVGSRLHQNTVKRLGKIGITLGDSVNTGQVTNFEVDATKHPEFKNMTPAEARSAISAKFGFSEVDVRQVNGLGAGKFNINTRQRSPSEIRNLFDRSLRSLDNGRIPVGMRFRNLARFHNVPSMFHPIKRIEGRIERAIDNRVHFRELERRRQARRQSGITTRSQRARTRINNALDGKRRALSAALVATEVMCLVRNLADAIPQVNYGNIVAPAQVEAADIISLGDQLGSSQDFTLDQIGARTASLTNEEGESVWASKPLNAMANGGAGTGEDIDPTLKQAFTPLGSEEVLKERIGAISGISTGTAGDIACSTPGLIIQGIAGIALTIFSGGAWTVGKVGITAAHTAVTIAAIGYLMNEAVDRFTEDPIGAFSGPLGGAMLAFGARSAFNMSDISTGSVELSNTEETALVKEQLAEDRREFGKKSFLAKLFDRNDYRSVASTAARSSGLDSAQDVSRVATTIFNPFKLLSGLSALTTTKVGAQAAEEEIYDWGFPKYGIPQEILNSPKYEDYLDNASKAAASFEKGRYIERAKDCFGVDITKGADGWDAVAVSDVNPANSSYKDADCADIHEEGWARTMMFVYDTSLLTSVDCYEGNQSSCKVFGLDGGFPAESALPPGEARGVDTSAQTCTAGSDAGIGDTPDPNIKIRLCNVGGFKVNVAIENNVKSVVDGGAAAGLDFRGGAYRSNQSQINLRIAHGCGGSRIYDGRCKGTPLTAVPGRSMHEWGLAVDFSCGGRSLTRGSECFNWLRDNQAVHNLINLPVEPWHWSSSGG